MHLAQKCPIRNCMKGIRKAAIIAMVTSPPPIALKISYLIARKGVMGWPLLYALKRSSFRLEIYHLL